MNGFGHDHDCTDYLPIGPGDGHRCPVCGSGEPEAVRTIKPGDDLEVPMWLVEKVFAAGADGERILEAWRKSELKKRR